MGKTNKNTNFWDKIFPIKPILSDKEAEYMEKIVKKVRRQKGFRGF